MVKPCTRYCTVEGVDGGRRPAHQGVFFVFVHIVHYDQTYSQYVFLTHDSESDSPPEIEKSCKQGQHKRD